MMADLLPGGTHRLRILLTEGSSLSARQTILALGRAGHHVELCDPNPVMCSGRFSRYVQAVHRCPPASRDPLGYLRFLAELLRERPWDVLFPSHDQVVLLSRFRHLFEGRVGLAVPEFSAIMRLQGKAEFLQTLDELGLPHPPSRIVHHRAALEAVQNLPRYVKVSYSTAGRGTHFVPGRQELLRTIALLEGQSLLDGQHDILVQEPAPGTLGVAQSIFRNGELMAVHCTQARALGVGGSARAREGVDHPEVVEHMRALGRRLGWHGALVIDYLFDPKTGKPSYIDANPRIGETFNALLSGVNFCDLLARIAANEPVSPAAPTRPGVRTHNALMSLLFLGEQAASRWQITREIWQAWRKRGLYEGSEDEMTRLREDPPSAVPFLYIALRLLIRPVVAKKIIGKTVDNYSLSAEALRQLGAEAATSGAAQVAAE
jgi:predicted ATP-grasp superfamily ATP-dependent carboligase